MQTRTPMKMKILLVFFILLSFAMTCTAYVLFARIREQQFANEAIESDLNKLMETKVRLEEELHKAQESR